MFDGDLTPRDGGNQGHDGRPARRSAWAKAKIRLLELWDYPPAALFWLVLTAGTITVLKLAGL
jgi:hypothetical protein